MENKKAPALRNVGFRYERVTRNRFDLELSDAFSRDRYDSIFALLLFGEFCRVNRGRSCDRRLKG